MHSHSPLLIRSVSTFYLILKSQGLEFRVYRILLMFVDIRSKMDCHLDEKTLNLNYGVISHRNNYNNLNNSNNPNYNSVPDEFLFGGLDFSILDGKTVPNNHDDILGGLNSEKSKSVIPSTKISHEDIGILNTPNISIYGSEYSIGSQDSQHSFELSTDDEESKETPNEAGQSTGYVR